MGDRRHEVDGVDELSFQARYFQRIEAHGLALEEQRLAVGDRLTQAFLVIVRDVDQAWPFAAPAAVLEHLGQRPTGRLPSNTMPSEPSRVSNLSRTPCMPVVRHR